MPSNLDRTLEARAVRYQKLAGRLERAAAACMLVASPVLAQDPDTIRAAPDTIVFELSPVEVLVSIAPRAAPSIGSGMPARISTVSRDQIDSWKPRLVTDLLSTQAGVSLYDDLGSPYKLNLSARGFNVGPTVGLPAGLSVFLDGIRQNEPAAQEVNFDLLPMEHVERVEFLRGNASLLGPNSLGGAVNLITRRGGEEARGEIELSAGSFAMKGGKANASGRLLTNWDYYVGGGLEQESGWRDDTSAEWFNGLVNLGRTGRERGVRVQALWADSRAETAGSLPESLFEVEREVNFTAGDFEALELQQITAAGYRPLLSGRAALTAFFRRTNAERFNVNQPPEGDVRSLSQNNTVGGIGDWRRPLTLDGRPLSLRVGFDLAASWTRVRIFEEERDGTGRELMTDVESPSLDLAAYAMVDLEVDRPFFRLGPDSTSFESPSKTSWIQRPTRSRTSRASAPGRGSAWMLELESGCSGPWGSASELRRSSSWPARIRRTRVPCPLPSAMTRRWIRSRPQITRLERDGSSTVQTWRSPCIGRR